MGISQGQGAETALQHERITEVWVVREGTAVLSTGGRIVDAEAGSGAGDFRGSAIEGGVERIIKAGDLVFIPTGVPHGIKPTESIVYLNIRFELREADQRLVNRVSDLITSMRFL